MARIVNGFAGTDPSAEAIGKLGMALFGDRTSSLLNKEKLYAAQRANTETDSLMDMVRTKTAQDLSADGGAQAAIIGSGYDPKDFGSLALLGGATEFGAKDARTQALQIGTGQSYRNTSDAFDADLAETVRNNDLMSSDRRYVSDNSLKGSIYGDDVAARTSIANNEADNRRALEVAGMDGVEVIGPDGLPTIVRKDQAPGQRPVISETDQKGVLLGGNFGNLATLDPFQREVLGANPKKGGRGIRVNADGSVEIGGEGLTESATTAAQGRVSAADDFLDLSGRYAAVLKNNPTSVGPAGYVRDKGQEVVQTIGNLTTAFGGAEKVGEDVRLAREEIAKVGGIDLLPELYDPSISEAKLLGNLIIYKGAAALADQKGASLSRQDVEQFKGMLGDPQGFFESAQSLGTKLQLATDLIRGMRDRAMKSMGDGLPATPPSPGAAPDADLGGALDATFAGMSDDELRRIANGG